MLRRKPHQLVNLQTLDLEDSRLNVIEMSSEYVEEVVSHTVSSSETDQESSAIIELRQQLSDKDKRRAVCQKLTFEICADLIATEMVDIFKALRQQKH